MKLIVTGTGRCGTRYVSQVIQKAGLYCGHEERFSHHGEVTGSTLERDSSWMAAPYMHEHREAHRVLIWREPEQVIASFMGIGFFTQPSLYRSFHGRFIQPMGDAFQQACTHYVMWNHMAMQHADLIMKVTDLKWNKLLGSAYDEQCVHNALAAVPNDVNARKRARGIGPLPLSVVMTREMLAERSI